MSEMSSDLYPDIDLKAFTRIKLVAQMVEEDPGWLDDPGCPYNEGVKDFFRKRVVGKAKAVAVEGGEIDLVEETMELYRTLKSFGSQLSDDSKEFLAWVKLASTVQEKLLNMNERAYNVKRQKALEAALFAALEVLPPHERTAFRDKLEEAIK